MADKQLEAAVTAHNNARRVQRAVVGLIATGGGLLLGSGQAFADTGADGGLFASMQDSLTTVILPGAAALIIAVIVFTVAARWVRKAASHG